MEPREDRSRSIRRVRLVYRLVELLIVAGLVYAFTVDVWLGALATGLWLLCDGLWGIVIVELVFGVSLAHEAAYGDDIPRPREWEPASKAPLQHLVGRTVNARGNLRPTGTVVIGADHYRARTRGDFVSDGAQLRVVSVERGELLVELEV